ncbi:unnamed protein product [Soboliphyme baturini]|uniref:ADAM 17-like protease n=1 Tax=Soboliphyme baturini TaxID=241478 RepID=A0A183IQX2_9BILA|nr:unnamed protein product [Soboliphyme baturini]
MDRVNVIYTQTIWRDNEEDVGFTNMGFMVKNILVHTSATKIANVYNMHYNMEFDGWDAGTLLQRFSELQGSDNYCLVHLFTYQGFKGGVLGLGYIASPRPATSGGICGVRKRNIAFSFTRSGRQLYVCSASSVKGKTVFFNTALSSARSFYGGPVVTREADLVTAHELGHNWGSLHDPASPECSPKLREGGPYLMYLYSVSGYDPNNKVFSPCSRRAIKAVLVEKSLLCFTEPQPSFCGNQRIEEGEECDVGLAGESNEDVCCSANCKLKPSAQCSGESAECPDQIFMPDGTPCLDEGECRSGECVSFCERQDINMAPCICENVTESCYRCCRASSAGECQPFLTGPNKSVKLTLADGTRCIQGYCKGAVCKREVQDIIEYMWDIIEKLDINGAVKLLRNNIVGVVIILTLMVWVPAGIVVHRIDKKMKQERDEEERWKMGDRFAIDDNRITKVKRIQYIHLPKPAPTV